MNMLQMEFMNENVSDGLNVKKSDGPRWSCGQCGLGSFRCLGGLRNMWSRQSIVCGLGSLCVVNVVSGIYAVFGV
jgi:hypothetical protein